jgi:hypothetical protein
MGVSLPPVMRRRGAGAGAGAANVRHDHPIARNAGGPRRSRGRRVICKLARADERLTGDCPEQAGRHGGPPLPRGAAGYSGIASPMVALELASKLVLTSPVSTSSNLLRLLVRPRQ